MDFKKSFCSRSSLSYDDIIFSWPVLKTSLKWHFLESGFGAGGEEEFPGVPLPFPPQ